MNVKHLVAALALAVSTGAFAGTFDLGTLDADETDFGRQFWRVDPFLSAPLGNFTDYYSFRLVGPATTTVSGGLDSFDYKALDLTISRLTLSGGTLGSQVTDTSPGSFSFSGLGAGTYLLGVAGRLSAERGESGHAGYSGSIHAVAAPVPEPEHALMLLAGLAGFAVMSRRRNPSFKGV